MVGDREGPDWPGAVGARRIHKDRMGATLVHFGPILVCPLLTARGTRQN